jgi:hypothetical protein
MYSASNDTIQVFLHHAQKDSGFYFETFFLGVGAGILIIILVISKRNLRKILQNIRPKECEINIPGFKLSGNLSYKTTDQEVAWRIYIEMVTRVALNTLEEGAGILREAMDSLHNAFGALRETLKNAGAEIAKSPKGKDTMTVTALILIIMNLHLRPFLSKWHPLLQEYEKMKPENRSQFEHEKLWDKNEALRRELSLLQVGLNESIIILKNISEGIDK